MNSDYLVTGETVKIRENGATSGVGVLATYSYDDLGRRTSLTFGYDPVSRLATLANDLSGTANDLSATFAYNPASQITANVRTGDTYAWTGHFNQNVTGTPNGLNQLTAVGAKSLTHDTKGNVTAFGAKSFTYSSENLLLTGPGSTSLSYDGLMRLRRIVAGGATTNLVYDGLDRIAEVSSSVVQRRYVHGPGVDEPIVWYEGSGTTDRRFLSADERGSIVSVTNSAGGLLGINRYDEYGQPQSTNLGVWGYTGQAWIPSIGAWYYKARVYEPEVGRFLQPDPIGYAGGPNLYAYVGNDPVNFIDPSGTRPWTLGESVAINATFGGLLKPVQIYAFGKSRSSVPPGGGKIYIAVPNFRADFSTEFGTPSDAVAAFWHELYHAFEIQMGITTWWELFITQISNGFDSAIYNLDPSKDFLEQNPEARAKQFEKCMMGGSCINLITGFQWRMGSEWVIFTGYSFKVRPHPIVIVLPPEEPPEDSEQPTDNP